MWCPDCFTSGDTSGVTNSSDPYSLTTPFTLDDALYSLCLNRLKFDDNAMLEIWNEPDLASYPLRDEYQNKLRTTLQRIRSSGFTNTIYVMGGSVGGFTPDMQWAIDKKDIFTDYGDVRLDFYHWYYEFAHQYGLFPDDEAGIEKVCITDMKIDAVLAAGIKCDMLEWGIIQYEWNSSPPAPREPVDNQIKAANILNKLLAQRGVGNIGCFFELESNGNQSLLVSRDPYTWNSIGYTVIQEPAQQQPSTMPMGWLLVGVALLVLFLLKRK